MPRDTYDGEPRGLNAVTRMRWRWQKSTSSRWATRRGAGCGRGVRGGQDTGRNVSRLGDILFGTHSYLGVEGVQFHLLTHVCARVTRGVGERGGGGGVSLVEPNKRPQIKLVPEGLPGARCSRTGGPSATTRRSCTRRYAWPALARARLPCPSTSPRWAPCPAQFWAMGQRGQRPTREDT